MSDQKMEATYFITIMTQNGPLRAKCVALLPMLPFVSEAGYTTDTEMELDHPEVGPNYNPIKEMEQTGGKVCVTVKRLKVVNK